MARIARPVGRDPGSAADLPKIAFLVPYRLHSTEPCHFKRDQSSVTERSEYPVNVVLTNGLEEIRNVHLHKPAAAAMPLGATDDGAPGMVCKTVECRRYMLQDCFTDPGLHRPQTVIRNGN